MDGSHTRTGYFIALLLASINAEEKWSWSKNDNGGNNGGNNYLSSGSNSNRDTIPDRTNVRSDVIQFQDAKRPAADDDRRRYNPQQDVRQGRYEVKETTTRRPSFGKPLSDEFSGEVNGPNKPNDFGDLAAQPMDSSLSIHTEEILDLVALILTLEVVASPSKAVLAVQDTVEAMEFWLDQKGRLELLGDRIKDILVDFPVPVVTDLTPDMEIREVSGGQEAVTIHKVVIIQEVDSMAVDKAVSSDRASSVLDSLDQGNMEQDSMVEGNSDQDNSGKDNSVQGSLAQVSSDQDQSEGEVITRLVDLDLLEEDLGDLLAHNSIKQSKPQKRLRNRFEGQKVVDLVICC
ncbi:hypothetical protein RP20_CCG017808 [Aedes albopictus]|nr:hypothetical protein RP20_CCG017808 [Aedes albopictus]